METLTRSGLRFTGFVGVQPYLSGPVMNLSKLTSIPPEIIRKPMIL